MNENERKIVVRRMLLLIAVACMVMGLYTLPADLSAAGQWRQFQGQGHQHHGL